tara:strand:+ start:978 stop:1280 length:303 start_codon:yes stop_codon:yes gene_type:complete
MEATETNIDSTERLDVAKPKKYQVVVFNDDQTPMEFVIELLIGIFKHNQQAAEDITVAIHTDGKGIAGVYYFEIAEQKVAECTTISRSAGFPLSLDIEEL